MTISGTARFADEALDRARALGTATLHEAAGRSGALPSGIRQITAGLSIAGPALTVECPPMDNLWLHRAVIQAQPGDVLVVSVSGAIEGGYWGEVLSHAAVARHLGGLVIDGGVRDTAHLGRVGLPVFARNVCIRGTGKDQADSFGGIGHPLAFGDVEVRTGDLVVADEDGAAVFPAADVDTLLAAAEARVEQESHYISRIKQGATTLEVMGLH